MAAIKSVATILADYDADQKFQAFGFGAKAPQFPDARVSHCFPLNFDFNDPEVVGIQVSIIKIVCLCVCVLLCVCMSVYRSVSVFF